MRQKNELNLKDSEGNELNLEESDEGVYTSGTYYEHMKSVIEESLNNFLNDTQFPYSPASDNMQNAMPAGNMPSGDMPSGDIPQDNLGNMSGELHSGDIPSDNIAESVPQDNMERQESSDSTTYNSPEEYVASLNNDFEWITYDSSSNTVNVANIEGFVKTCKNPSKNVGAFDDLERTQAENNLFGTDKSDNMHFDKIMSDLLKTNNEKYSKYEDFNADYVNEYENDLNEMDSLNNTIQTRVNMYNPMYYLCDYYNGGGTSNIAKFWRINSGIEQTDTSSCVEVNLALALNQSDKVEKVDFSTVWNQGHTTAERTGDSTDNFINWINQCLNK